MAALQGSTSAPGLVLTDKDLNLTFEATFSNAVTPFKINVDQKFLDATKLKLSLTRYIDDMDQPEFAEGPFRFSDGPPRHTVEKIVKYWCEEYDWREIEASLNTEFEQFTTIVQIGNETTLESIPLHFIHHRSPRKDAIPLLFIHGWPGSFLEVDNLLKPLTNPENDSLPAFHVVAPSIPGYGFSPSARKPGMGYRKSGVVFHALMRKLGYPKFVWQGGDAGDFIGRLMSVDFPDAVISAVSNFWNVPPTADDITRYRNGTATEDEKFVIEQGQNYTDNMWSYGMVHQTRPLKLAIGLGDSPIGLAMWIYDLMIVLVQDQEIWTPERIITWTMMHYINGPYGPFSLYKNGRADGVISLQGIGKMPYVSQPVASSQFLYDNGYRTPLDWARRGGNVKYITRHECGGHFAALETPGLLVQDIRKFFGNKELSGTTVFT